MLAYLDRALAALVDKTAQQSVVVHFDRFRSQSECLTITKENRVMARRVERRDRRGGTTAAGAALTRN